MLDKMKLEDLIEKTEVEDKTVFIKLKDGREIVVGKGNKGILGKTEKESVCYTIVDPALMLEKRNHATNLYTGEQCGIRIDTASIKEHYRAHPALEIKRKLDDLENEIKISLIKSQKIRPIKECFFSGLYTLVYPLTIASAILFFMKTKYPFEGIYALEDAVGMPAIFIDNLKETISPSRSRKVANKSLLSKNPTEYSIGICIREQDYPKYSSQEIQLVSPDEEHYKDCKYFCNIGKQKFEAYDKLVREISEEEKKISGYPESIYRQELIQYLEKNEFIKVISQ